MEKPQHIYAVYCTSDKNIVLLALGQKQLCKQDEPENFNIPFKRLRRLL